MTEGSIEGIAYVAGDGLVLSDRPALVFIHGAAGSNLLWHHFVQALSPEIQTIALDLPGHGRSEGPGSEAIQGYAEAVIAFLDRAALSEPVLCGHSMGGAIALQLALNHPGRFPAIIVVNSGPRLSVSPRVFEVIEKNFEFFSEMIGLIATTKKNLPDSFRQVMAESAWCDKETVLGDFRACQAFDATPNLPSIQCPVLVFTSGEDRLTPAKYGDVLEKGLPACQRIHVADAGHFLPLEEPDAVEQGILEFLRRISPGASAP